MKDEKIISTICAWCMEWLDKAHDDHHENHVVSHSICEDCSDKVMEDIEAQADDKQ